MLRGEGRLAGPGAVAVGDRTYTRATSSLATGSDPTIPPIPGLDDIGGVWGNREATGVTTLPGRLIVIGGGPGRGRDGPGPAGAWAPRS